LASQPAMSVAIELQAEWTPGRHAQIDTAHARQPFGGSSTRHLGTQMPSGGVHAYGPLVAAAATILAHRKPK
jgi:hypothetical protein